MKIPNGYIETEKGLWVQPGLLALTPEEKSKICNGIGAASGLSKHIPSTIWGLDCHEAGDAHDYDYYKGGNGKDRRIADQVFLHNLYVLIGDGCWILQWPRNHRARTYYVTLRLVGWAHYNFSSDEEKATDIGETVMSFPEFGDAKASCEKEAKEQEK